jgi:hypothetical protein
LFEVGVSAAGVGVGGTTHAVNNAVTNTTPITWRNSFLLFIASAPLQIENSPMQQLPDEMIGICHPGSLYHFFIGGL